MTLTQTNSRKDVTLSVSISRMKCHDRVALKIPHALYWKVTRESTIARSSDPTNSLPAAKVYLERTRNEYARSLILHARHVSSNNMQCRSELHISFMKQLLINSELIISVCINTIAYHDFLVLIYELFKLLRGAN